MADKLTPEQAQAVTHRGSRLLVSAAAGSGKTKVLVDRLMSYICDPVAPANIDDFLMITYTKAAAAELRGKIAAKLSEYIAQEPENRHLQRQLQRLYLAKISTVHAFCGDILREYAYRLDISGDFRVADENECRELRTQTVNKLLEQAYETAGEDPDFCAFIDTQGLGRDDRQVADLILSVYDSARCHLNPEKWLQSCRELVQTEAIADASGSVFGEFLMKHLQEHLALQIGSLEYCARQAADAEGFEKPAALLLDTVHQLKVLRDCSTWDQVVAHKNIDYGRLVFSKNCTDEELKENIKIVRESCKTGLAKQLKAFPDDSAQVLADLESVSVAVRGLIRLVEAFGREYDKAKRSRQVVDFSDLEHRMLDLLLGSSRSGPTAAAHEVGSRFREVMVDEYQDSNAVQDAIYGALTRRKRNLFMVGDVKQSIYQFRLADPGIFLEKYHAFSPKAEATEGEDTKVVLSRNFRSGGGVLAAANDVFRLCMCKAVGGLDYGPEEALYEGVPHVPLNEPETELYCIEVQQETYPEEAVFAASRIRELLDGAHYVRDGETLRPIRPEDIAILLRSPGSTGRYYQNALEKVGIRCATGGGVDLLQVEEIATLRAILQAVHNPMLDIPLIAAMASPVFGFTADDLARLRSVDKKCAFYEAVKAAEDPKTKQFLQILLCLRDALRHRSLTGLLEMLILRTNLDGIYGAMDDGAIRLMNIQTFLQMAAEFEAAGGRELGRFLEHLDAMEEKGLITAGEQSSPGCVTIMSIHKSKGLEFPVVFLCGLSKSFNTESQRAKVLCHKEMGLGLSAADGEKRIYYPTIAKRAISAKMGMEAVSEEMRVLYVAMTRARDRLIMTYASNNLEKGLTAMVGQLNLGGRELLIRQASSFGDWILLTALHRTEAGALFALGGKPADTAPGEPAWRIEVVRAPAAQEGQPVETALESMPADTEAILRKNLTFRYAYIPATAAPSKQTATQRKGRQKDQEAAENTHPPREASRKWRKPGFVEDAKKGTDRGTATHAAMQYLDYGDCQDAQAVAGQLRRMVEQRHLTQEQAELVNCGKIVTFFETPLGEKLRSGCVEREFKFSVLEDGEAYDPALQGEQVLLQGVVDCALLEDDGITIVDFKTDYVTEETVQALAQHYTPQVQAYADAMERIFCKPVKKALLYFFCLDRFLEIQ